MVLRRSSYNWKNCNTFQHCNLSNNLDQLFFSTLITKTVFHYSNNFLQSPSLLRCSGNLAMMKLSQTVNSFPVTRLHLHFSKVLSFYWILKKRQPQTKKPTKTIRNQYQLKSRNVSNSPPENLVYLLWGRRALYFMSFAGSEIISSKASVSYPTRTEFFWGYCDR